MKESLASKEASFDRKSIGMSEWSSGNGPEILETLGLGPCIGIAIYDPLYKKGFMTHIPAPYDQESILDGFLDEATNDASVVTKLKVWVRGGLVAKKDSPEQQANGVMNREYTLQRLADIGIDQKNLNVRWAGPRLETADMELNCLTGKFRSEVMTMEDYYMDKYCSIGSIALDMLHRNDVSDDY